jgi:hypothetical protein
MYHNRGFAVVCTSKLTTQLEQINPYVCRKDISLGTYAEHRTLFFFPIMEEEHLLIHLGSCREGKQGVKQLHFEKCKQMKLLSTLPSATSPKNKK